MSTIIKQNNKKINICILGDLKATKVCLDSLSVTRELDFTGLKANEMKNTAIVGDINEAN